MVLRLNVSVILTHLVKVFHSYSVYVIVSCLLPSFIYLNTLSFTLYILLVFEIKFLKNSYSAITKCQKLKKNFRTQKNFLNQLPRKNTLLFTFVVSLYRIKQFFLSYLLHSQIYSFPSFWCAILYLTFLYEKHCLFKLHFD